jgi:hypothetical protein
MCPPKFTRRSLGEGGPFVAWHSRRQNSTGRWTSFCVVAYTVRFGEGVLTGQAQFKKGLNHRVTCPSGIIGGAESSAMGSAHSKEWATCLQAGSSGFSF